MVPSINFDAIPPAMKAANRWCLWRVEEREGKTTKVPYSAREKGFRASSTNPATWAPYEEATTALESGEYAGLGFMLGKDDKTGKVFIGLDLDKCRDAATGTFDEGILDIVHSWATYAELSPSGSGVHVIGYGEKPPGSRCRKAHVEIYDDGRFFTVTGNHLDRTPTTVEDIPPDAIAAVCEMVAGPKVVVHARATRSSGTMTDDQIIDMVRGNPRAGRLFRGSTTGYDSPSEATLSLLDDIAFYTKDAAQIDRIFRRSGLMRSKWDEPRDRGTWGALQIKKALTDTPGQYDPLYHMRDRIEHGKRIAENLMGGDAPCQN